MTGVMIAWSIGDLQSASIFFKVGTDLSLTDKFGRTALHFAWSEGTNPDLIEKLIKLGADVNAQSIGGETPLMKAICFDHVAIVKVLLDNEADPEIQNGMGRSAIDFVQASRSPPMLEIFGVEDTGDVHMSIV